MSTGIVTSLQLAVPQQLALLETAAHLLAIDLNTIAAEGNEAGLGLVLTPAADVYGEDHLLHRAREIVGLAKRDPREAATSRRGLVGEFISLVEHSSAPNPRKKLLYLKRVLGMMEPTTRVIRMGIDVANAIALKNQLESALRNLQERGTPIDIFIIVDKDREATVKSKLIHVEGDPSDTRRRLIVEAKVVRGSLEGEKDSYSVIFSDRKHPLPMELSEDVELGNLSFNITLLIDGLLLTDS